MLLLIDECVPEPVTEVLRSHGYAIQRARDLFPPRTPDGVIATHAERIGAVLVTWNAKHFRKRAQKGKLSCVWFTCPETEGRERLEQCIEWLDFAIRQVQDGRRSKLVVQISPDWFRIHH